MQSLVRQDFKDLVDTQPGIWTDDHNSHPRGGCVTMTEGSNEVCLGSADSKRIRFMPIVKTG